MIVGIPILVIQVLKMSDMELGITKGVLALGGLFGGFLAAMAQKRLELRNAYRLLGICALCVGVMGLVLLLNIPNFIAYVVITLCLTI